MENPDEKVIIEAFRDAKKLYLCVWGGGGGLLTYLYVNNNQNISSNIMF